MKQVYASQVFYIYFRSFQDSFCPICTPTLQKVNSVVFFKGEFSSTFDLIVTKDGAASVLN
jgi:hypothetical protein